METIDFYLNFAVKLMAVAALFAGMIAIYIGLVILIRLWTRDE